ncbi:MAG: cytochrome bc complex cytochrome b subunit [Betaproteobacteria bacterium]|nr:cytochrome bc complex cytochrome b subunit [Betaproteobacteria bacterium]
MAATKKEPVVIEGAGALNTPLSGLLTWVDQRFPLMSLWKDHLAEYYAPKNFNFWYYFGLLAMLILVLQIVTGIFLVMHYKPSAAEAFASVEYIMRDVPGGWLIRYMHSTGASAFFVVIYLHMFRGLMYGSYRAPRELVWIFGMIIYLCLMAEAFFGYLLPWGQMSYWGAQVIINLFDALPIIGPDLSTWIRGDFVVGDATLNRFFAFHVIAIPLALLALVGAHIMALHEVGSNNPDGVEIKENKNAAGKPVDGIPFHPYYTVKDSLGVVVFAFLFCMVMFFAPEMGGYFLEYNNFIPADPLKTPPHIAPVWYFTPYYSILRAVTEDFMFWLALGVAAYATLIVFTSRGCLSKILAVLIAPVVIFLMKGVGFGMTFTLFRGTFLEITLPLEAKVWGVILMGLATLIFFLLPWLDKSPVKSIRYKGVLSRWALTIFVAVFLILGYYGTQPVTDLGTLISQIGTLLYFAFFLLMPWYTQMEQTRPVPSRVTM